MSITFHTPLRLKPVFLILLFTFSATIAQKQSSQPVTGLKDNSPDWTVLINANVITKPGQESENFQIVIQRDVIRDVRKSGAIPAGARVIDLTGKTVYPGFIDAYSEVEVSDTLATQGAPHWNSTITPQLDIAALYENNTTANSTYRSQGFTTRLAVPKSGIIRGTSAVVICGAGGNDTVILRDQVFQHFLLTVSRGRGRDQYPNSPMGAVALARQTLLDTQWYEKAWSAFNRGDSAERPERNDALEKLTALFGGKQSALFVTENEQFFLRANRFAEEFSLSAIMLGSGKEYQRLDAIKQTGRTIILPIAFPTAPNVGSLESARSVSLEDLMHWDIAPENPSRVANAGIPLLLTSHGLTKKSDFLKNLRRSVQRGLSPVQALTALTTQPATELGISHLVGSITKGKLASLIITNGDIFESDIKIEEVWVAGQRFELQKKQTLDVTGNWEVVLPGNSNPWTLKLSGNGPKLSGELRQTKPKEGADQEADTSTVIALSKVSIRDTRVSAVLPGKHFGYDGFVMFTLTFTGHDTLKGTGHWTTPDGKVAAMSVTPKPVADATDKETDSKDKDKPKPAARATYAVNYPLGAFGRSSPPNQPKVLLIKNATIWTSGQQGILTEADMLVQSGRITAVGKDLRPPRGAMMIDATGKHLTAGIIDCHSHMATDGGVNESAQAITAEVRIGDFIDAHDMTIYRQLAGGVTMANILHGSANPIGGQNQVVKLRWGSVGEAMKFVTAPAGIKFALGENVKQSNWGDEYTSRYPQTRMGVQQIMQDAFFRAQQYKQNHAQWEKNQQGTPPRIDLELEALKEILDGQRWIHCHSYRQDEILTLMRTLEQFQIQIGTFQHILEGYKVAEEMAEHGAMGSSFSDWWAYKLEVYDAIPYNGALMHNAGVVVSFNSDDRELGRHLNHEAAKAVKYGGVPPEEALKFVTLNPARQLRIDQFVGSLENGKQADFVIWSGDPLSVFSRCEQTWIDGKKYFDREQDIAQRNRLLEQRTTLIQKVLASGEAMLSPGEKEKSDAELWPREDLFCAGHRHIGSQCNHGQQSRLQQLMRLINEEQRRQTLEK